MSLISLLCRKVGRESKLRNDFAGVRRERLTAYLSIKFAGSLLMLSTELHPCRQEKAQEEHFICAGRSVSSYCSLR